MNMSVSSPQSRSRQEDPEQLRLKQKAKEVSARNDKCFHEPVRHRCQSPPPGLTAVSPLAPQMQQQELAQIRHREANLTALAAIGPRKKRKMDSPVKGAGAEVGA